MIRPNFIGAKSLYLNPAVSKLSTANLAAIDGAYAFDSYLPYAYSATVSDTYDSNNFCLDDAGANLVAGQRVSFGLFLSPQNDLKNLLFQVSGGAKWRASHATAFGGVRGSYFFGRKATNNTVVSDLASANNTLAKFTVLRSWDSLANDGTGLASTFAQYIQDEVYALELSTGYVYCFGYELTNHGSADVVMRGGVSLAFRKYNSELGVFRPSR